jgi:hypothetical protein
MSRFFLHIRNSVGLAVDEEGQEFPDLAAAEAEAFEWHPLGACRRASARSA